MKPNQLAKISYETVRAYNQCVMSNYEQKEWDKLSDETKKGFEQRVVYLLEHRHSPVSALHDKWMVEMLTTGWRWGNVLDKENKTHPKLMPFSTLPQTEQLRDLLFARVVEALV